MDDVPTIPASPARAGSLVGDNEPHSVTERVGLHDPRSWRAARSASCGNRNSPDLIADEAVQRAWVGFFARLLPQAYQRVVAVPQAADELPSTQKKPCVPPSRVEAFTRPRAAIVMRYAALYKPDSEPLDPIRKTEGWYRRLRRSFLPAWGEIEGCGSADLAEKPSTSLPCSRTST